MVDFLDQALSHGQLEFSIEELSIAAGSPLADRDVAALRRDGVFVLAIVRGDADYEANPPDSRVIQPGEVAIISGPHEDLRRLAGRA